MGPASPIACPPNHTHRPHQAGTLPCPLTPNLGSHICALQPRSDCPGSSHPSNAECPLEPRCPSHQHHPTNLIHPSPACAHYPQLQARGSDCLRVEINPDQRPPLRPPPQVGLGGWGRKRLLGGGHGARSYVMGGNIWGWGGGTAAALSNTPAALSNTPAPVGRSCLAGRVPAPQQAVL